MPELIELLAQDDRRGAQRLVRQAERRLSSLLRDRRRFQERFRYERALYRRRFTRVAGVDEVGRGPLAGPVVAAAVILPADAYIRGLDDSKRLRERERDAIADAIRNTAIGVAVGIADVDEIDTLNIFHAAQLAMRRAILALRPRPDHLLVDGVFLRGTHLPQLPLTGGDGRSNSIAAASVIAKTYRDQLMTQLDDVYPGYGFARHKGYATPEHREALRQLGPSPLHRKSFRLSWQ